MTSSDAVEATNPGRESPAAIVTNNTTIASTVATDAATPPPTLAAATGASAGASPTTPAPAAATEHAPEQPTFQSSSTNAAAALELPSPLNPSESLSDALIPDVATESQAVSLPNPDDNEPTSQPVAQPDALAPIPPLDISDMSSTAVLAHQRQDADSLVLPKDHLTDLSMPSPPTVSPLSTPAATHINVDDIADDDLPKLNGDSLPAPSHPSSFWNQHTAHGNRHGSQDLRLSTTPFANAFDVDNSYSAVEAVAMADPDYSTVDFSAHRGTRQAQGSIDPNAYVMNMAQELEGLIGHTDHHDEHPSAVHPSAVSLHSFAHDSEAPEESVEPTIASGSQTLESFAKVIFADSVFQMTTYGVIIGRDQRAMNQARMDEKRKAAYKRKCEERARLGLPLPPSPTMRDRSKFSKSYVSEEGGMLGPECSDGEDELRQPPRKRRLSSANRSAGGEENSGGDHGQWNRQYVSHTTGAAVVDMGTLQPSPDHIPFLAIHSPGPDIAAKTKGISRQHLKIQFNKQRGVFEAIALHKNGFFCQDKLHQTDRPVILKSGDRLQIKDVEFDFVINGVPIGKTGGEDEDASSSRRMSVGGKEMSLDFEHDDHRNFRDTSDEGSDVNVGDIEVPLVEPFQTPVDQMPAEEPALPQPSVDEALQALGALEALGALGAPEGEPLEVVEEPQALEGFESLTDEQIIELLRLDAEGITDIPPELALPLKRRGPGRPPKDGIMSKRERRLLKKQLQESTARKTLPQDPQSEKIKRPVGRPRKNPIAEDGDTPEKRKYMKKKDGETGSDVEKRVKEKKDKKVRPKSPPLELRREDYTEEQLQKPSKNYGVLIDEALTNEPSNGLTLKQIYKRIQARYPWFYFMAETKGWESSVRHNLIGNEAFLKDEETSLWSRVPGVELDAGKKRKANSPDRHLAPPHLHSHLGHAPYYQTNPYANANTAGYPHNTQSYSNEVKHPQQVYATTPGQAPQSQAPPTQPVTQQVYASQTPAPAQLQLPAAFGASALPRPSPITQQSTYSSPYARPPPSSNPPAQAEKNMAPTPAPTVASAPQPVSLPQQSQPVPPVTSSESARPLLPQIEEAIQHFRVKMMGHLPHLKEVAVDLIDIAIRQARGLPKIKSIPNGFEPMVNNMAQALDGMIKQMEANHRATTTVSPAPASATAPAQRTPAQSPAAIDALEADIQLRLKGFRDSMITAFGSGSKFGDAATLVDNAIARARGFPHPAVDPQWSRKDEMIVDAVKKIIAEAKTVFARAQSASPASAMSAQPIAAPRPTPPVQANARTEPSVSPAVAQNAVPRPSHPTISGNSNSSAVRLPTPQATSSNVGTTTSSTAATSGSGFHRQAPAAAPTNMSRPPTNPLARPAVARKDSVTVPYPTAAHATVTRPNVSSPAPPSAGVLDQISGQRRFLDNKNGSLGTSYSATSNTATNAHAGNLATGKPSTSISNTANHAAGNVIRSSPSHTPSRSLHHVTNNAPVTVPSSNIAHTGTTNPPTAPAMKPIASTQTGMTTATKPSSTVHTTSLQPANVPQASTTPRSTANVPTTATGTTTGIQTAAPTLPRASGQTSITSGTTLGSQKATPPGHAAIHTSPIPKDQSTLTPASVAANKPASVMTPTPAVAASSNPGTYAAGSQTHKAAISSAAIPATTALNTNRATHPPTIPPPAPTSGTPRIDSTATSRPAAVPVATPATALPSTRSATPTAIPPAATNPTTLATTGATPSLVKHNSGNGSIATANNISGSNRSTNNATSTASSISSPNHSSINNPVNCALATVDERIKNNAVINNTTARTISPSGLSNESPPGSAGLSTQTGNMSSVHHARPGNGTNDGLGQGTFSMPQKPSIVGQHHNPLPAKVAAPVRNVSSPAPPSAGVVAQIAGHKRTLDEGPGASGNVDQPEPKRHSVTTT